MNAETNTPSQTGLLTIGVMIIGCNSFLLSPVLTDVATSLATGPVVVARAISAFGGATALSAFVFSFTSLASRFGIRRILFFGAAIMAVALAGCALSPSWQVLAVCQALAGLVVGVMLPAIYAAATANAPDGQGAAVLGKVIRGWGIALVLGVPFSAFVSDLVGWRWAYWILAAGSALTAPGFLRLPKISTAEDAAAGVSLFAAIKLPGVVPILFICLAYMIGFYGLFPFLGAHLNTAFGASASAAGVVVLAYGAGFGLASFAMQWLERRGLGLVYPMVMAALALIYLVLGSMTGSMVTALPMAFVWGAANHVGVNLIILMFSRQGAPARPTLMGLHTTITYGAIFVGPLVLGALFSRYGFGRAAWLSAALLLVAAILAWRVRGRW